MLYNNTQKILLKSKLDIDSITFRHSGNGGTSQIKVYSESGGVLGYLYSNGGGSTNPLVIECKVGDKFIVTNEFVSTMVEQITCEGCSYKQTTTMSKANEYTITVTNKNASFYIETSSEHSGGA